MPKARLAHAGLSCENPQAQACFYQEMFGMELIGGTRSGSNTFVCSHPDEENHDIAFFRRNPGLQHLALRVASPEDLLEVYHEVKARQIKIRFLFNHGFSLALYFPDPEGNLLEVYWATGRDDYSPPYVESLTLEGRAADDLRTLVREMPSQQVKHADLNPAETE